MLLRRAVLLPVGAGRQLDEAAGLEGLGVGAVDGGHHVHGVAGHLDDVAGLEEVPVREQGVLDHPAGAGVVRLDAQRFLVEGEQEGAVLLELGDDDAADLLRLLLRACLGGGGGCLLSGRDVGDAGDFGPELGEEVGPREDVHEHPEKCGGRVDEDADEVTDLEGPCVLDAAEVVVGFPASSDKV